MLFDDLVCHSFQEPFNKVSFELIGDDTGPSFFQLEPNGDIKLRSGVNLPVDKEIQYTVSHLVLLYVQAFTAL